MEGAAAAAPESQVAACWGGLARASRAGPVDWFDLREEQAGWPRHAARPEQSAPPRRFFRFLEPRPASAGSLSTTVAASSSEPSTDLDALHAHSAYVRGLARELVFDAGLARDVEQETWLAALEHAPRD